MDKTLVKYLYRLMTTRSQSSSLCHTYQQLALQVFGTATLMVLTCLPVYVLCCFSSLEQVPGHVLSLFLNLRYAISSTHYITYPDPPTVKINVMLLLPMCSTVRFPQASLAWGCAFIGLRKDLWHRQHRRAITMVISRSPKMSYNNPNCALYAHP